MGRVITNGTSLTVAREASPGVLPAQPDWLTVEPNAINSFGTTISTTARSPISKRRSRRKGAVTDLDSSVEVEADVTLQHLRMFVEGFCDSRAIGADAFRPSAITGGGYAVPALSAAQAGRLIYAAAGAKSLVAARGFVNPGNNGLKVLSAKPAAGAVTIPVAGLTAETPAATALTDLCVAGVRGAPGDIDVDAQGNLTSTVLDFTTLGVAVGQVIHVGGADAAYRFASPQNFGFARVVAVAPNKLTLSKRDQPYVADDGTSTGAGGANISIDILFGQFVRNVPVDSPDYQETTFQFELGSPNLMPGGLTGYEYSIGNYADAMSVSIPLTGKATVTLGFIGKNTLPPTSARATNSALAKTGGQTGAFGTASDIARLRVQDVDESGLSTDFKSATFTLGNNAAGEKVLAVLGPKYVNIGQLECDVENQLLFTNPDVVDRIRLNKTTGFDWVLRNGDGGLAFDLPTGTLAGGGREFPVNESVLLNDTFEAYEDDVYGYTIGFSFFPVLPAAT